MIRHLTIAVALLCLCGIATAQNQQSWGSMALMRAGRMPSAGLYNGFATLWVVTNGGSLKMPLSFGTTSATIDWGDGTITNITAYNDPGATHTFTSGDSNRVVVVSGTIGGFNSQASGASPLLLRSILSWGPINGGVSGLASFQGCANLTSSIPVELDVVSDGWLSTGGGSIWYQCAKLQRAPNINSLTNISSLVSAYRGCNAMTNFSPVSNLGKVTTIGTAWQECSLMTDAPNVNSLFNVTDMNRAWLTCTKLTNASPVNNLTKNTTLVSAWQGCVSLRNPPEVNTMTNCTSAAGAWSGCTNLRYGVSVCSMTKITSMDSSYLSCAQMTSSVNSIMGDCLWITGQLKNVTQLFDGCRKLAGQGMPLVTAMTNSPSYPTGYSVTACFRNCTNLSDYADIPAAFK